MLVRNGVPDIGHGLQPELLADAINREEDAKAAALQHTTPAKARLRVLFLAAKIWRHAGRVGVSYRLEIGDLAVTREHPLA